MKTIHAINQNILKRVTKFLINLCCLLLSIAVTQAQELRPTSIVKKSTKIWGYEDETGKMVIEPKYEYAEEFKDGTAKVWYKNKCGYIDKTGKEIIPTKYDGSNIFSEDLLGVKQK